MNWACAFLQVHLLPHHRLREMGTKNWRVMTLGWWGRDNWNKMAASCGTHVTETSNTLNHFLFPGILDLLTKISLHEKIKIFPSRDIIFCLDLTTNPRQGVNLIHFIIQVFASNWKQVGNTHVLGSFKSFKYNWIIGP